MIVGRKINFLKELVKHKGLNTLYQFSWLQPLVHDRHEPITVWLRLDGMALSRTENTKDKSYDINKKFMIMFPSAEHSMSLHPHDFM